MPVLSQQAANALADNLQDFDFVKMSCKIRRNVLRGVSCSDCRNAMTGSHSDSVLENSFVWDQNLAFCALPCQELVVFVKETFRRLALKCRPLMYMPDILNMFIRETGTVGWIPCNSHRLELISALKSEVAVCYAVNLCKEINLDVKKRRDKVRTDIVEQALSDAFSEAE